MAVQRIEWQCPGCGKKFAIPDQTPRPKLCPHCAKTRMVPPPRPPAPPAPTMPAVHRGGAPLIIDDDEEDDDDEDFFESPPMRSAPITTTPRPVKRQRYEELRTISLWFKIIAGLTAVGYMIVLGVLAKIVLELPISDLKTQLILSWFAILIGGITNVMLVYAFAVLLLVAKDIEFNTRQD